MTRPQTPLAEHFAPSRGTEEILDRLDRIEGILAKILVNTMKEEVSQRSKISQLVDLGFSSDDISDAVGKGVGVLAIEKIKIQKGLRPPFRKNRRREAKKQEALTKTQ